MIIISGGRRKWDKRFIHLQRYHKAYQWVTYYQDNIINEMMGTMADTVDTSFNENEIKDAYWITEIWFDEQPLIPVSENMWLIRYMDGYYIYEGVDGEGLSSGMV